MSLSRIPAPEIDPTPIFEYFRGAYATELLTATVAHFDLFRRLAEGPRSCDELGQALGLAPRPLVVLTTALRAMKLLEADRQGRLGLTDLARDHLVPGAPFDVSGYIGLAATSPGVLEMVERLRTNRPAGAEREGPGAAFIYRDGIESAMERQDSARALTLALAGRARNVAPVLVAVQPISGPSVLLDVGGGTGIYSITYLRAQPDLRAVVWDRPEVLKVAEELGREFGVLDRMELVPGDMFTDPVPRADVVLLSNILHDWDVPQCRALIGRLASALPPGGQLWIHDVFLNDALDGPLPIALYSAALFSLTEGRAYSAGEYRDWLREADLVPGLVTPTAIHCGLLPSQRTR